VTSSYKLPNTNLQYNTLQLTAVLHAAYFSLSLFTRLHFAQLLTKPKPVRSDVPRVLLKPTCLDRAKTGLY